MEGIRRSRCRGFTSPASFFASRAMIHSLATGLPASGLLSFKNPQMELEVRSLKRKLLLETLDEELPSGTVRFSSKLVFIEDLGFFKLIHLADGASIKAKMNLKVLIGCDGVNSKVAKWLGFKKPDFVGRSAIRGHAHFNGNHGFEPKFMQFVGGRNKICIRSK